MRAGTGDRWLASAVVAVLVLVGAVGEVVGQDLWSTVEGAPDGSVRFEYAARAGVCGDGENITIHDDDRDSGLDRRSWSCDEGPVRIELRVRGGKVFGLTTRVGGDWSRRSRDVTSLGTVDPVEASEFLFRLAETSNTGAAEDAIFPATIARDVETWPRLLEIARVGSRKDVRRQAVFWLGQEAGERATVGLTSIIESQDELDVREHAIFALSQRDETTALDALIQVARENPEPALRKRAIFWLGQRGDDPRVLDLLEELLRDTG